MIRFITKIAKGERVRKRDWAGQTAGLQHEHCVALRGTATRPKHPKHPAARPARPVMDRHYTNPLCASARVGGGSPGSPPPPPHA